MITIKQVLNVIHIQGITLGFLRRQGWRNNGSVSQAAGGSLCRCCRRRRTWVGPVSTEMMSWDFGEMTSWWVIGRNRESWLKELWATVVKSLLTRTHCLIWIPASALTGQSSWASFPSLKSGKYYEPLGVDGGIKGKRHDLLSTEPGIQ